MTIIAIYRLTVRWQTSAAQREIESWRAAFATMTPSSAGPVLQMHNEVPDGHTAFPKNQIARTPSRSGKCPLLPG